jgi:hypothetical protein
MAGGQRTNVAGLESWAGASSTPPLSYERPAGKFKLYTQVALYQGFTSIPVAGRESAVGDIRAERSKNFSLTKAANAAI